MNPDNVTAAPPTSRDSGAGSSALNGGAAFTLPDSNSPTYGALCLKAGLEGKAPVRVVIEGTVKRDLMESHLQGRARKWALDVRSEFLDLVKDEHQVPINASLQELEDALHEIEYDLRDEWTYPSDLVDFKGPENSPNVIHNGQRDFDLKWNSTATAHEDARVKYRTRLYYSILALDFLGLGLFSLRKDNKYGQDLGSAGTFLSNAHAFRRQLATEDQAEGLRQHELRLLDRLVEKGST